jgi:hypothetical protein
VLRTKAGKEKTMITYRVPIVIRGFAIVKYADGKASADYISGLPGDAEKEVSMNRPFICGARMEEFTIELAGHAEAVK